MNSIKGKRVVITGPTSGVGKEIALQLVQLGAELILGCRDLKLGQQTAAEIARLTGSSKVLVMPIDTSSQASIREFARAFRKKVRRLDVLINNASGNRGTLPKINSADGVELTFATNVLGYFLLTQELLGVLQAGAPGASGRPMRMAPPKPNGLLRVAVGPPFPENRFIETTAPSTALAIRAAEERRLGNFSVFCNHVLTPPAMAEILGSPQARGADAASIDGIVPGQAPARVIVSVDGREVTAGVRVTSDLVACTPGDLGAGRHEVDVQVLDAAGTRHALHWEFYVLAS